MYEFSLIILHGGDLPGSIIWLVIIAFFIVSLLPFGLLLLLINYLGNKADEINLKEENYKKQV
jgi:hypothetical protein